MQIVIDIPDKTYDYITKYQNVGGWVANTVTNAILGGISLPKGHGRLIDADVLDRDLENAQVNLEDTLSEAFDDGLTCASEVASKSPTIIEADKEEE